MSKTKEKNHDKIEKEMRSRKILFNAYIPKLDLMIEGAEFSNSYLFIFYETFAEYLGIDPEDKNITEKIESIGEEKKIELMCSEDYYYIDLKEIILKQFSGYELKNRKKIFEGNIVSLINDANKKVIIICEFGIARREVMGITVDISGFYFRVPEYDNKKTFPIVNNYAKEHDLDLFKVIGDIDQNPELLKINN